MTPAAPGPDGTGSSTTARNSATVSVWTLVSRVTGLARVVVIGAVLGPTYFANTFLSTNLVPNLTYSAVAGPVLGMVVVPVVVQASLRTGPGSARSVVRRLSTILLGGSGVVVIGLVLAAPGLAWALTLAVPDGERERAHQLAVLLVVLVAPQVLLYTVAALGAAAQQARGRFALAAAAPAAENLGLIVTMALVPWVHRTGPEVSDIPLGLVVALGLGSTAAVAVHAGLQVFGAARVGLPLTPGPALAGSPEFAEVLVRLRRSVSVAIFPAAAILVMLVLSATEPGGVLVVQTAFAVYGVCAALGARAITTAVLPRLSMAAGSTDVVRFAAVWREALSLVLTVSIPAVLLLVLLAEPAATLLAHGELGVAATVSALAGCIAVLGLAQLPAGVHEIGRQALFARLDVTGPRLAGGAALATTATAGTAAVLVFDGSTRLIAIAAAVLLADTAAATTVVVRVRRALGAEPVVDRVRAGTILVAALVALPPLVLAAWTAAVSDDRWTAVLAAVVLAPVGAVAYVLVLRAAGRRRPDERSAAASPGRVAP